MLPDPDLQPTVPLWPTAGQALGMGKSATYRAHNEGTFPVTVIRCGKKLRVATAELRRLLALDEEAAVAS